MRMSVRALRCLQRPRLFGGHHQGQQRDGALRLAVKAAVHDDLVVARGQHPAQWPATPVALFGTVAGRGHGRLLATRQAAHVHIQELPVLGIVMALALAVLAIDRLQRRLQVGHGFGSTGIQGVLSFTLANEFLEQAEDKLVEDDLAMAVSLLESALTSIHDIITACMPQTLG